MKYKVELDFYIDEDDSVVPCTQEDIQHIFQEELEGCCTSISNVKILAVVEGENDSFLNYKE